MTTNSWQCPFCQHLNVTSGGNVENHRFDVFASAEAEFARLYVVERRCLNERCQQLTLDALWYEKNNSTYESPNKRLIKSWRLRPASSAKPQPECIPKPLRDDYEEACLVKDLSPKSAATLARRCLQGMIRDFHGIKGGTLNAEINELNGKIEPEVWDAIDAVRKVGNIGAHMEKDISNIVDVDPKEAQLLISLVEQLFADWYVTRDQRKARMQAVKDLAIKKDGEKKRKGVGEDQKYAKLSEVEPEEPPEPEDEPHLIGQSRAIRE